MPSLKASTEQITMVSIEATKGIRARPENVQTSRSSGKDQATGVNSLKPADEGSGNQINEGNEGHQRDQLLLLVESTMPNGPAL